MWELDCEESWAPKNWCFWTVVLEKTLESPLDCEEIQPDHSEGDQSWVFFGRTDAEAETPILWLPHVKSWLIGKDPDAGRDWGQEEKGTTEDEMAGWHHRLNGREFEWTPGVGDGQRAFHLARFMALYKHPLKLWLLFVVLHDVCLVTQLCPTLCDPMDCSLPGSSTHGILQAGILEWVTMPPTPSGNLPNPGIEPRSPALQTDSLPSQPQFLTCQGKTLKTIFFKFNVVFL